MGSEPVTDPTDPRGTKRCITFGVANSALINDILTHYPGAGNGSVAICALEGVFKMLIDGVWV